MNLYSQEYDTKLSLNKILSDKLELILHEDQKVREIYDSIYAQYGSNSLISKEFHHKVFQTDSINQIKLDDIYNEYGWLIPPQVTTLASKTYFFIIQHAPLEYQNKYKADMLYAYNNNIISELEYKYFIDRNSLYKGKYQLYGTQINIDQLGYEYYTPIDTVNNVNIFTRNMDIDKRFQYIDASKFITIFVHVYDKSLQKGIYNASVYMDNNLLGHTNKYGFICLTINRNYIDKNITVSNNISKVKLDISDLNRDYFDFFITLNE